MKHMLPLALLATTMATAQSPAQHTSSAVEFKPGFTAVEGYVRNDNFGSNVGNIRIYANATIKTPKLDITLSAIDDFDTPLKGPTNYFGRHLAIIGQHNKPLTGKLGLDFELETYTTASGTKTRAGVRAPNIASYLPSETVKKNVYGWTDKTWGAEDQNMTVLQGIVLPKGFSAELFGSFNREYGRRPTVYAELQALKCLKKDFKGWKIDATYMAQLANGLVGHRGGLRATRN